jgi:hypothetical protein
MRAMFDAAGIERELEILDETGRPHRNIEVMRWRTGEGLEVAALHGPADRDVQWRDITLPRAAPFKGLDHAVPVTVQLAADRYVYDMRTGHGGSRTRTFTTAVRPWWAMLLVLSDRELTAPVVVAADRIVERGETIQVYIKIPDTRVGHAIKIRVSGPTGEEAPWFDQSVIVEDQSAVVDLPIAYNEQIGTWTVTATDLYTNASSTASFDVR